jgi:hypothetical protein
VADPLAPPLPDGAGMGAPPVPVPPDATAAGLPPVPTGTLGPGPPRPVPALVVADRSIASSAGIQAARPREDIAKNATSSFGGMGL